MYIQPRVYARGQRGGWKTPHKIFDTFFRQVHSKYFILSDRGEIGASTKRGRVGSHNITRKSVLTFAYGKSARDGFFSSPPTPRIFPLHSTCPRVPFIYTCRGCKKRHGVHSGVSLSRITAIPTHVPPYLRPQSKHPQIHVHCLSLPFDCVCVSAFSLFTCTPFQVVQVLENSPAENRTVLLRSRGETHSKWRIRPTGTLVLCLVKALWPCILGLPVWEILPGNSWTFRELDYPGVLCRASGICEMN